LAACTCSLHVLPVAFGKAGGQLFMIRPQLKSAAERAVVLPRTTQSEMHAINIFFMMSADE
jgi:hypothetical protein